MPTNRSFAGRKDAFIAAGSTVNHDVPDGSGDVGRQINKDGWVACEKQKE